MVALLASAGSGDRLLLTENAKEDFPARPLSAVLVGGNWLLFIWAVNNHYMLEASLGYFINPLVNILLGMIFLTTSPNAVAGGDSGGVRRAGANPGRLVHCRLSRWGWRLVLQGVLRPGAQEDRR